MWSVFCTKENSKKPRTALISAVVIIFFIVLVFTAPILAYEYSFQDRIYRGVEIDGIPVGGLTKEEARQKISDAVNTLQGNGVNLRYGSSTATMRLTNFAIEDPDLTYDVATFDTEKMVSQAYDFGRTAIWHQNAFDKAKALFEDRQIPLSVAINREKIDDAISLNFPDLAKPSKNPEIIYKESGIEVTEGIPGNDYDIQDIYRQMNERLSLSNPVEIKIKLIEVKSQLLRQEIIDNIPQLQEVLNLKKVTFIYEDKTWELPMADLQASLYFEKVDGNIKLTLNRELAALALEKIANEVNIPAQNAEMEVKDGKVVNFLPSQDGWEIKIEPTLDRITENVLVKKEPNVELVIDVAKPKIEVKDINELGIVELLGVGESDYSGSPKNRQHNIAVGAKSVDGTIIPPGEEFSLLKVIGDVDASTGYKQELVIKDNKTIPEYGGGLCQIGTTTFRGALAAGLKITYRRNHSYRVGYYEPAGTDATIYSPAPDFKFLNDTSHHVLIKTVNDTKNSKLYFQYWGTSDGRKTEMTKPVVYNKKSPPPTKLIETLDLKPGVKRCTESAHAGADAYFIRTITKADGTPEEEKFTSHYRPWQAVCLIGVEKLTEPEPPIETPASIDSPAADAVVVPPAETVIPTI